MVVSSDLKKKDLAVTNFKIISSTLTTGYNVLFYESFLKAAKNKC